MGERAHMARHRARRIEVVAPQEAESERGERGRGDSPTFARVKAGNVCWGGCRTIRSWRSSGRVGGMGELQGTGTGNGNRKDREKGTGTGSAGTPRNGVALLNSTRMPKPSRPRRREGLGSHEPRRGRERSSELVRASRSKTKSSRTEPP